MKGFPSVTVPQEQYREQLRPILEKGGPEAELIRTALTHRKRRRAAFERQVHRYKFYQIMPIVAMDWYIQQGFHCHDSWAYLFKGQPATAAQQAKHLQTILNLLETYRDHYQIGLLTGDPGEYDKVFWEVKGTHTVGLENYHSGEELDVSITESTVAKAFREEFKTLWESEQVITDPEDVKKWLHDHAKERASAIS